MRTRTERPGYPGRLLPILLAAAMALPAASAARDLSAEAWSDPDGRPGSFRLGVLEGPYPAASGSEGSSGRFVLYFEGEPAGVFRGEGGHLRVEDLLHPSGPAGPEVQVPSASTWLALPPGSRATVALHVLEEEALDLPGGLRREEMDWIREALPERGVILGKGSWVRNQWGLPVGFYPVRMEGSRLVYVTRARLEVRYSAPASFHAQVRPAGGGDAFENLYRAQFINYEQGRTWRRAPALDTARKQMPDGGYFDSTPNPWVRLLVPAYNLYKVTGGDLQNLGLDLESVDPLNLRLFTPSALPMDEYAGYAESPSWMREVPITVEDGGDGAFDLGDQIVFLGQGPDGWYRDLGVEPTELERHFRDPYVSASPYWLTWGGSFEGEPARIPESDGTGATEPYINLVQDRRHFELEKIWDPRPKDTRFQPGAPSPLWERFWWLALTTNISDTEQRVFLDLPSPVTDRPVRLQARFWGNSYYTGKPWPDHAIRVSMNGTRIVETDQLPNGQDWDWFSNLDIDTTGVWLVEGEQEIAMVPPVRPLEYPDDLRSDQIFLAWIEADYTRRLEAEDDTLTFFAGGLGGVHSLELREFAQETVRVLDATDPLSPSWIRARVETDGADGYRVRFRTELDADRPGRFLARGETVLASPEMEVDPVPEGGYLRPRTQAVDAIIVAHADFLDEAERLAAHRSRNIPDQGAGVVAVVDIQDVMDEFGLGRSDPTALRNFFEFARDHWNGGDPEDAPAYAVLLGDTHYDLRDFLGRGAQVHIPSYEMNYDPVLTSRIYSPQFATDDYFAYLEGPDDVGLDLYLSRMPVRTAGQAATVVDKIIRYETARDMGAWTNRITLVADDACQGTVLDNLGFAHMSQTESLEQYLPRDLQRDKIYLYDYGAECVYDSKPDAADALVRRINEGTLLVNYTGHGSDEQLADERIFEISSLPSLTNRDRLFLLLTASCSVGKYNMTEEGLAEVLLLYDNGGCMATFTASAIAFSGGNAEINRKFYEAAFPGGVAGAVRPLGEAEAVSKGNLNNPGNLNSRRYSLLGDGATRLAVPARPVELSLTEARTGEAMGDTLRRGVLSDLSGAILDSQGRPDAAFQGTALVRIYDSQAIRRTDGPAQGEVEYALTGAPIFRGEAEVADGVFDLRFLPPDALRTGERGEAQIFVQFEDGSTDGASSLHLFVPETEAPVGDDREGPQIEVEFQGDPENLAPRSAFIATLTDTSGINITRLVGSRSVLMQVEEGGEILTVEDVADRVVFGDDYTRATMEAVLPAGLAEGRTYDLVLKASDNVRNSSTVRVPFTLRGGSTAGFELTQVYNFPNPTNGPTRFYATISQEAEVDIQIFTVSGRRIWRLEPPVRLSPFELSQQGVVWDGRDADGDGLANGLYLYKITARPVAGGKAESTVERLVVAR